MIWLSLDKKAVEIAGEPMLSSSLTPKNYRYSEVFTAGNRPWKESNVWKAPRTPESFYVTHNESGNPVLVITPADNALYRIQRDSAGESIILTELGGVRGETLYFTDRKASPGIVYTYRVIPIHQELLNNGVLLEGAQSVQIAQAKSTNLFSNLWEDITGRLFGTAPEDDDASASMSLFWQSSQ